MLSLVKYVLDLPLHWMHRWFGPYHLILYLVENSLILWSLTECRQVLESCTHLEPKHFYLEVVHLLCPTGCSDVLWLCGHTDVNGDLKVVLLLANEGLISCRVVEAFICVDMVGWRRPGNEGQHPFLLRSWHQLVCPTLVIPIYIFKIKTMIQLVSLLTVSGSCCHTKCSTVLA